MCMSVRPYRNINPMKQRKNQLSTPIKEHISYKTKLIAGRSLELGEGITSSPCHRSDAMSVHIRDNGLCDGVYWKGC